jgi:hypothetical protein
VDRTDEAVLRRRKQAEIYSMTYETKKQQREQFLAEFLRRLREAPPGTRVYMPVGDVFRDADVHNLDELRAARQAAVVRDNDEEGEDGS